MPVTLTQFLKAGSSVTVLIMQNLPMLCSEVWSSSPSRVLRPERLQY